jgi:hypothetical protein
MTSQATITITPAEDGIHCGECEACWLCKNRVALGWARQPLPRFVDGFERIPACLAAEKAAGALLRQCPRCKGTGDAVAECEPQEYPGPCRACLESPVPGWIPVEVDHG